MNQLDLTPRVPQSAKRISLGLPVRLQWHTCVSIIADLNNSVVAEYLAKGYVLSDQILQRAIDLDNQHGISSTFLSYWNSFDSAAGSKVNAEGKPLSHVVQGHVATATTTATEKAKALDTQTGVTARGQTVSLSGLRFSPLHL
jgi:hypothetical protein